MHIFTMPIVVLFLLKFELLSVCLTFTTFCFVEIRNFLNKFHDIDKGPTDLPYSMFIFTAPFNYCCVFSQLKLPPQNK